MGRKQILRTNKNIQEIETLESILLTTDNSLQNQMLWGIQMMETY